MQLPGLRLRLATSQLIRKWARRQLPNGKIISGQILNPKTINYLTLKPEKDGLFCERLFGPTQDSLCACGRQPQHGQKFCPRCEVEYISTRVRRYRLGYIQLVTAAAHFWFFKGRPSYLSLFLNLPKKKIEGLLYCTQNISRTIFPKELENLNVYSTKNKNIKIFLRHFSLHFVSFFSISNKSFTFKTIYLKFWKWKKTPKLANFGKATNELKKYSTISRFESILSQKKFYYILLDQSKKKKNQYKSASLLKNHQSFEFYFLKNKKNSFLKKNLWKNGGLRDSSLFFSFALVSKKLSWHLPTDWFCFVYFLIRTPQQGDVLNKFYPGPPGLVNFWGFQSRLFCFTGVQIMRTWLVQLTQHQCNDGRLLEIQIHLDLLNFEKNLQLSNNNFVENVEKIQLFRRFKYLRAFRYTQMNPSSTILSVLPVLPPDLRPILQLDNNQIAVSDFNKLYQTVLFRNKRVFRLTTDMYFHCLNSETLRYGQRLLQESVDSLIENSKVPADSRQRPLKCLSDLFKGKKGRFRQNLLGKRVDYSGRSVIVVGPYLKIYECGLPKEIAYELFQPFLLRYLMVQKHAQTIVGAKKILKKKSQFLLNLLNEIVHSHPILLNRAPTLHRLSIQAFQPRLIEGRAILLHPLVCAAFNADFDGDQMGIHLPLCFEARAEAWKITWSQNNLFSVATGAPVCPPSQDMILGSSFLTSKNIQKFGFTFLKNWIISKKMYFIKTNESNLKKFNTNPARLARTKDYLRACNALIYQKEHCVSFEQGGRSPLGGLLGFIKNVFFSDPKNHVFFNTATPPSLIDFSKKSEIRESILPSVDIHLFTKNEHPFKYSSKKNTLANLYSSHDSSIKDGIYNLHSYNQWPIWCSYNPIINGFETEKKKQKLIEIRLNSYGNFYKFRSQLVQHYHSSGVEIFRKIRTTYGRLKFYKSLF
uniref:DNA-directed RNA polymerase subunit n=1 Tax=Pseudochlorodesmis sp. HV01306c TaxID=2358490 RepID=A0A386AYF1_9CHLO|nr:RNA polymerase b-subunit [Pseudochlorodesmis sp. HV01306c]